MRAQCFSAPVQRRYYAGAGSLPHIISVLLLLIAVFVPLFLAHGSRGFWPKTNTYSEQPRVQLTYQVIAVLEGEHTDENGLKHYIRVIPNSLPPRVQRLLQEDMRASQIKVYETDSNRDGSPESLYVRVTTPLQNGETIHQARAFVFLTFTLQSHVKLNMDAMAAFTYASPLPGTALRVDGDLQLSMRAPARVTHTTQTPYARTPLVNMSRILGASDFDFDAIVSSYRARDWHTHFVVPYPMWTTDVAPSAAHPGERTFEIEMTIRIPTTDVLYRPTWGELLKTAWIQYFSVLVIIYGIAQVISAALFKNRVLDTYSVLDDPLVATKNHQ